MTNEEVERAIEFLLKNQANFDSRLEQTNQQLTETNRQLALYTETQSEFMQTVLRYMDFQNNQNTEFRQAIRELANAQQQTQQEISDLAKIVNNLVNFSAGNGNKGQE